MKYGLKYSRSAVSDLERVLTEVRAASSDPETAIKYIDDLMDKVEQRCDFLNSGAPLYYDDSFTGYYYLLFKAYIVFYRVDNGVMYVDRILYGKSDYLQKLKLFPDSYQSDTDDAV